MELSNIMINSIVIFAAALVFVCMIAYMIYLERDRKRWKSTAMKYRSLTNSSLQAHTKNNAQGNLFKRFKVINTTILRDEN